METEAGAVDIVFDALALTLAENAAAAVIARRMGRIEKNIAESGAGLRKVYGAPPKSPALFPQATFHQGKHRRRSGEMAPDFEKYATPVYFSQSGATFSAHLPGTDAMP